MSVIVHSCTADAAGAVTPVIVTLIVRMVVPVSVEVQVSILHPRPVRGVDVLLLLLTEVRTPPREENGRAKVCIQEVAVFQRFKAQIGPVARFEFAHDVASPHER